MVSLTLVVLTYNRCEEVASTLAHLRAVAPDFPVVVVDNASTDGTAAYVARHFPQATLLRAPRNLGAAGRNLGVEHVQTPYVAFCDDDTRWDADALHSAVRLLDGAPRVAILNAAVYVGEERRPDPACLPMRDSPLGRDGLPGIRLLGFMAGASIVRVSAFREAGGFWPPFLIGGEEDLLAMDLVERGWEIVFVPELSLVHLPSSKRVAGRRERLLLRNGIWLAWMRLPWPMALAHSKASLRHARRAGMFGPVLLGALLGAPRALAHRRELSPRVLKMWRQTRGS